jgi:hypothetical protein
MATAAIELRSSSESEDTRRQKTRRELRLLLVLGGALGLAFWSAEETSTPPVPPLVSNEARHDFGEQSAGAAVTAQIVLQNSSAAPFDLRGDGKLGSGSFAVDASPCAHVDPGSNCTITVTFTPSRSTAYAWSFRLIGQDESASGPIVLLGKGLLTDQSASGGTGAPNCDCSVNAGLLTAAWRDDCIARESQLMKLAVAGKLNLQFDSAGKIISGELCSPVTMGPRAWPATGKPATPPIGVPRATPCTPSGLLRDCGPNQ